MYLSIRTQKFAVSALRLLLILVSLAQISAASDPSGIVNLVWDPNPETNIAGYLVHYGTASGDYSQTLEVSSSPGATLAALQIGITYYCVVQAFNTSGLHGLYSSEISFSIPEANLPEIAVAQASVGNLTELTDGLATINFGTAELGTPGLTETFILKNPGTADLTGLAITVDDDVNYSVLPLGTTTLAPGEFTVFNVTFAPSAAGSHAAVIHIISNETGDNNFDIMFTGTGAGLAIPILAVENADGTPVESAGAVIPFGSVIVGSTGDSVTYVISNSGTAELTGLQVETTGLQASSFVLDVPPVTSLEPGTSTRFTVTFEPTSAGSQAAAIRITSDSTLPDTLEIGLDGTGIAVPEIEIIQDDGSNLTSGSDSVSLGNCNVGTTSSARTFTIKNSGSAVLSGLSVASDDSDFMPGNPGETTLAPGASTTFQVSFRPNAAGACVAHLAIASNDADESPFSITLTGQGINAPEILIHHHRRKNRRNDATSITSINRWATIHIISNNGDEQVFRTWATNSYADQPGAQLRAVPIRIGSKPRVSTSPVQAIEVIGGRKYLTLTFAKTSGRTVLPRNVEVSSNLLDWSSGTKHTTVLLNNATTLKVRDNIPVTRDAKRYIRLRR